MHAGGALRAERQGALAGAEEPAAEEIQILRKREVVWRQDAAAHSVRMCLWKIRNVLEKARNPGLRPPQRERNGREAVWESF